VLNTRWPVSAALMAASIVSTVINMLTEDDLSTAWIEGAAIFSAVAICVIVTAVNDYQKEKQFQELNKVADDTKTV